MKTTVGEKKALEKKIPTNPKYSHIRSSISTGSSISNKIRDIEEKKREGELGGTPDEPFKRISPVGLARLLLAATADCDLDEYERKLHSPPAPATPSSSSTAAYSNSNSDASPPQPHAGTNNPNAYGVKDLLTRPAAADWHTTSPRVHASARNPDSATDDSVAESGMLPFLLLDVREKELYSTCHIVTASSYPSVQASRTMTQISRTLLTFKARPERPIVVYDVDGEPRGAATTVAVFLLERGWENVRVLSGGLNKFSERFKGGVIGVPPLPKSAATPRKLSAPAALPSSVRAAAPAAEDFYTPNVTSSSSSTVLDMKAVAASLPRQFDLESLRYAVETAGSTLTTPAVSRCMSRAPTGVNSAATSKLTSRVTSRAVSPKPGRRATLSRGSGTLRR
ncbi:hypothetical protein SeLEV6574_g04156 [Synchytrium endobioticum]|nr:hypothetical protein SeLEV6574_g04156 [Synchytrium endobioticum]